MLPQGNDNFPCFYALQPAYFHDGVSLRVCCTATVHLLVSYEVLLEAVLRQEGLPQEAEVAGEFLALQGRQLQEVQQEGLAHPILCS